MKRTNAATVSVKSPAKGLMTRPPSDQPDGQQVVVAQNVRAERGALRAAPGYERVNLDTPLDGEALLIHTPNLTSADRETQTDPVVGTSGKLYSVRRRARTLTCPVACRVRFAALADSGDVGATTADVAAMIRNWSPDLVVHAGDLVYPDGGTAYDEDPYETQVAKHYWWAIGGYDGPHGQGPTTNKFFPALGNHDYTDGPLARALSFFQLPGNERWYTIKRGPVQFFFIDSYGNGPTAAGPGGDPVDGTGAATGVGSDDLSPTGPQGVWLQAQLAASDCPWRVVVWHHPPQTSEVLYAPGYAVMDWPLGEWGADVLITGHSHVYERILRGDGVTHFIVGLGGHDGRGFSETIVPESVVRYSGDYGALLVDATFEEFTASFFTRDLEQRDTVTLTSSRDSGPCYIGTIVQQVVSLAIRPAESTIPPGVDFPLVAEATLSDGSVQDVTASAVWEVDNTSILSVTAGKVRGLLPGSVTVSAGYEGLGASATVTVVAGCLDVATDMVVLYDRSLSMTVASPPNSTRIERLREAANLFIDTLQSNDRIASMSFSGVDGPDVTLHHDFTADFSLARTAVADLTPTANTGVSYGILQATDVLTGASHREGVNQLLVLFTDGFANLAEGCPPPGSGTITCALAATTAAADAAKALGITVAVVGLDLSASPDFETVVAGWASCPTLYYSVADARDLAGVFVRLRNEICTAPCGSSGPGVGLGLL